MYEQLIILKHSKKEPSKIIITSTELYGACRHTPRFHRYPDNYTTFSTDDELLSSEGVKSPATNNTPNSTKNSSVLCLTINESQDTLNPRDQIGFYLLVEMAQILLIFGWKIATVAIWMRRLEM